jgi:hypothetical protein
MYRCFLLPDWPEFIFFSIDQTDSTYGRTAGYAVANPAYLVDPPLLRMTAHPPDQEASIMDWWQIAKRNTPKPMRKGLASAALLIPWMIWKHRNDCIFDGVCPSAQILIARIKDEARLWARAGALGLRAVLPSTWDVH